MGKEGNQPHNQWHSAIPQPTFSRRGLFSLIGRGVIGAATGDLVYRKIASPLSEEERILIQRRRLSTEALALYPEIPLVKRTGSIKELGKLSFDELTSQQAQTVVTGYDQAGNPINLDYLEGNSLIRALFKHNYKYPRQEESFQPWQDSLQSYQAITTRDGKPRTIKPGGSIWTFEELLFERPDVFNEKLRSLIDGENSRKRDAYVSERLPQWTLGDTAQLGIVLAYPLLKILSRRLAPPTEEELLNRYINSMKDMPQMDPERLETWVKPYLRFLIQTFKHYAFDNLTLSPKHGEINVYSINCGAQGTLEAVAFSLLAYGLLRLRLNFTGESNQETMASNQEEWERLSEAGVIFYREDAKFISSAYYRPLSRALPFIAIMRNVDMQSTEAVVNQIKYILPMIRGVRDNGADARLVITSGTTQSLAELKQQLNILDDPGTGSAFEFIYDADENPASTAITGGSDKYVTVIGFKKETLPQ